MKAASRYHPEITSSRSDRGQHRPVRNRRQGATRSSTYKNNPRLLTNHLLLAITEQEFYFPFIKVALTFRASPGKGYLCEKHTEEECCAMHTRFSWDSTKLPVFLARACWNDSLHNESPENRMPIENEDFWPRKSPRRAPTLCMLSCIYYLSIIDKIAFAAMKYHHSIIFKNSLLVMVLLFLLLLDREGLGSIRQKFRRFNPLKRMTHLSGAQRSRSDKSCS